MTEFPALDRFSAARARDQQFGNQAQSLPVALTNRKSFCRKFVSGKEMGRSEQ
jgi:hypothetical protein